MRVAILGGGMMGCCLALALAEKGIGATIYDRNSRLMTRAAVANEGKIHLGYMYAADPSLKTAKAMMLGALAFAPFFSRHLGVPLNRFDLSNPAAYVVHRDSQRSVEEVDGYLRSVHALIQEHPRSSESYFGLDLSTPVRRWEPDQLSNELDTRAILAAFDSLEVAINPILLAALIRERIAQTPTIELRTDHTVTMVDGDEDIAVVACHAGLTVRHKFDHVVNALWDGRIAIDETRGHRPTRPWIHRLKYGVDIRSAKSRKPVQSITIISGPFGEVVNYANGSIYLTWYPSCLRARTSAVMPPHWAIEPEEPLRSEILWETFNALARILPALGTIEERDVANATVRGGPIVAWGETDIDDPRSELHRRYEIGVTSEGCYHSVDPGKLTAAPLFADECAERIAGPDSRRSYSYSGRDHKDGRDAHPKRFPVR